MTTAESAVQSTERDTIVQALAHARHFLTYTARDLTHEQAAARPTASELCIGGLIKHVTAVERAWVDFILDGPAAMPSFEEVDWEEREREFQLLPDETLDGVLSAYAAVTARTEQVIAELESLDVAHPLPDAPWFADESWSARRVLLHIAAETAQHAGHADIIRETIDGAKSMG